ncbi:YeeE/YedE thiosulfate transporter family protein [Methylopila musalis]|uniref:YeeE/YedE thiosulfate transporter family protein n=1 Tax=Methylopila musalis TaxID=1134781 RepID=A0ABW3Z411_9HYPH
MTTRPLILKHLSQPRPWTAAAVMLAAALACAALTVADGRFGERSWALVAGVVFGIALQRGELSLVRAWRDLMMLGDGRQLTGFLAALAVAATLTLGGFATFGLSPPANARIGPVDWLLPVAAFVFGVGSVVARGGVMVHLRRLSEGSLVAAPALAATFLGFVLGLMSWPWSWDVAIGHAPRPWLPGELGIGLWTTLALELAVVALCIGLLWRYRPDIGPDRRSLAVRILVEPWPAVWAGALLGALVAASYAAAEPLGLIAECATVARALATLLGLTPVHLPGLDAGVGGLVIPLIQRIEASEHVVIIFGFLFGAFACAVASGRFSLTGFSGREAVEMVVGGVMLGWGAMTALGAVTGEAIAGVAVGALSGWVFLAFASLGVVAALKLDPRQAVTAPPPVPSDELPEDRKDPLGG